MISREALLEQLKKLDFNPDGWGRTEVHELCNILMPDEEIEELVNGYYDAGFALLVATKERVLLVDKKPLNYLTVEDMRFDMISEFDYSHRIIGAHVSISSGNKTLQFTSLNQVRLRRLLSYVQARMTELKKTLHNHQETQKDHLEQMNEQLRQYLTTAQQQAQQAMSLAYTTQNTQPQQEYYLPQPIERPSEVLTSREAFERAAAETMGAAPNQFNGGQQISHPSTAALRKIVLTPQQVGLAAVRRVVPVVAAYSRPSQPSGASMATLN